jgi:short-subunit dehydrogenase
MLERRTGTVINVRSIAAFVTGPGNATYSGPRPSCAS